MSRNGRQTFYSTRRRPACGRKYDRDWQRKLRFETLEARQLLSATVASGPEFQVNTYTLHNQKAPKVASDDAGDYVVVWNSYYEDGSGYGVYAQRYNSTGAAQGSEFLVNTYTSGNQEEADVAMDSAGDFVVVWETYEKNFGGYAIDAQRYNAFGFALGSEFHVNSYTSSAQGSPSVAMDADGDFVVAWTSYSGQDGNLTGVYAQRFNQSGTPQGAEFQVNTYTTDKQEAPTVAMDLTGDFVIAWQSYGQDGSVYGIYAQRYNSTGSAQGNEFRVNTYTTNNEQSAAVAMDSAGDFVVAWESGNQDGSFAGVYAQRYTATGATQGSEFRVNTYTTDTQSSPALAMDSAGDFVVSWNTYAEDGNLYGVAAQFYTSTGLSQGSEFVVNTYTTSDQSTPAVTIDSGGDFVVAWQSFQEDGSYYGIYAQRYVALQSSFTQSASGSEFRVNTYTTSAQNVPSIASDAAGDYVVVWASSGQDGSDFGIYGQRYASTGSAQGSEFRVNTYTTNEQFAPSVAMDAAGDFVVAWQSLSQDGDSYGVYAQRYNATAVAQGAPFRVNTYTTNEQVAASVAMDSAGDFVIAWQSYGEDGSDYGVYAQRYNAGGTAQGGEFRVNSYTTDKQEHPSAAMDAAGDFVIAWAGGNGEDGSGYGIFAQRYASTGSAEGSEFRVNTYTTADQSTASAAMDAGGDFVITWQSLNQDGGSYGVYAQLFNSYGEKQGSQFRVNTYTTGSQIQSDTAMDAAGDFVVAWESVEDGSLYGVYAQKYYASGTAEGSEFRVNSYTTGNQDRPTVAMDTAGDFVVAWQSAGEDGSGYGIYAQRYQATLPTLTLNGQSNLLALTFTDATDFELSLDGGRGSAFSTNSTAGFVDNAPANGFSELIYDDPTNTYTATQTFTKVGLIQPSFNFQANNVVEVYAYSNGNSTATVTVGSGTGSNFFVDDAAAGYSYIGDPIKSLYSELSGFAAETVTGSGGSTYGYYYSTAHANVVLNPTGSTATLNGQTTTLANLPQLYVVGSTNFNDTVTLDSSGGEFVGSPQYSYVTGTSSGSSFLIGALYCATVTAQAAGSTDTAVFYSYAHNSFNGAAGSSSLSGSTTNAAATSYNFVSTATGFDSVAVFESGSGSDVAYLASTGNSNFVGTSTVSTFTVGSSTITVDTYFVNNSQTLAVPNQISVTGAGNNSDSVSVYDAAGTNALVAGGATATFTTLDASLSFNEIGSLAAYQQNGTTDTVHKTSALDFALSTIGNWMTV